MSDLSDRLLKAINDRTHEVVPHMGIMCTTMPTDLVRDAHDAVVEMDALRNMVRPRRIADEQPKRDDFPVLVIRWNKFLFVAHHSHEQAWVDMAGDRKTWEYSDRWLPLRQLIGD